MAQNSEHSLPSQDLRFTNLPDVMAYSKEHMVHQKPVKIILVYRWDPFTWPSKKWSKSVLQARPARLDPTLQYGVIKGAIRV